MKNFSQNMCVIKLCVLYSTHTKNNTFMIVFLLYNILWYKHWKKYELNNKLRRKICNDLSFFLMHITSEGSIFVLILNWIFTTFRRSQHHVNFRETGKRIVQNATRTEGKADDKKSQMGLPRYGLKQSVIEKARF